MALSLEVQAMQAYLQNSGVPHRVTATLGRYIDAGNPCVPHSPGSYHCKPGTGGDGLAIDVAGLSVGAVQSELLPIFGELVRAGVAHFVELIYAGAPFCVKNGQKVDGNAAFGPAVMGAHWNHVHAAVKRGHMLVPVPTPLIPKEGEIIMPNVKLLTAFPYQGGYVLVAEDGAVYCFGCDYKGGLQWNGTNWVLR